jgi:hypothetical protein
MYRYLVRSVLVLVHSLLVPYVPVAFLVLVVSSCCSEREQLPVAILFLSKNFLSSDTISFLSFYLTDNGASQAKECGAVSLQMQQ